MHQDLGFQFFLKVTDLPDFLLEAIHYKFHDGVMKQGEVCPVQINTAVKRIVSPSG